MNTQNRIRLAATFVVLLTVVPAAQAGVIVLTDPGSQIDMPGFLWEANGADMAGIEVTANFADGAIETVTWAATGATSGAVFGTSGGGWSLVQDLQTFDNPWTLVNNEGSGLTSLVIDAAVGNIVFDLTYGGAIGTVGSDLGKTFQVLHPLTFLSEPLGALQATVTYRHLVSLNGDTPVGDLYGEMTIAFGGAAFPSGFPSGGGVYGGGLLDQVDLSDIMFLADTDQVIRPEIVPEPSAALLGLLGAVGLLACTAKRPRRS